MRELGYIASRIVALGRDAHELVAEYHRCDDEHERNVVLRQIHEVDQRLRIHKEQAEGLAALPDTWDVIYGATRGYLGLFSGRRRDGKLTDPRSLYADWPEGADQAVAWVEREALAGRELYHCAHLLTDRVRRKEAAAPVTTLWVDRDTPATGLTPLPAPSLVVVSSPGHTQEYWRLRRPVPPEEGAAYNRQLAQLTGADPSGWDLTQLLRIPGTRNHKYPEQPVVRVTAHRDRIYDPALLLAPYADLLFFAPRSAPAPTPSTAPENAPPSGRTPTRTAHRILSGEEYQCRPDGSIDRSASLVQLGRVLHGLGYRGDHLADELARRDAALGWHKYTERPDAREQYEKIVTLLEIRKENR